ncbi:HK97 family phage prohead protease [Bacillus sp. FJAT-29814]|uniref:HK97 family phage prohead protease n=1 Tax=Bacillus sp. FJAT-29814 TaxID=1729688 RepID=UPI000A693109|nr:HK97 family phage prohead protease [Bacillus sp. FJAT-29814]
MTINKMELRLENMNLTGTDEGLKVSGYVNKTNQWSQVLGVRKKFVERIEPGAFRRALQNGNEIHFYAEHDPTKILASTRNGSLELREDEQGLFMSAKISDTSWGRDYHTLISDGIIQNMSFGMKVLKDSWKKLNDGTYQRSISDIFLAEVSAVRNPAYIQSTIAARSIEIVEDVEPTEEKQEAHTQQNQQPQTDEHPLQELIENKKCSLKLAEMLVANGDKESVKTAEKLKGEIRQMETQLKSQTATVENEKQEERSVYFIFGYPAVVNDNASLNQIIFGNMYDGYRTLLSTGVDPYQTTDIFGKPTIIDQRSFVLQKATDTARQVSGTPVYLMHAFFGGKVINKDCFVRLDIKTV